MTIADRFETMATAIAASYMNIPLAHIREVRLLVTLMKRSDMPLQNWRTTILLLLMEPTKE